LEALFRKEKLAGNAGEMNGGWEGTKDREARRIPEVRWAVGSDDLPLAIIVAGKLE
jgi:hypothetical protein